MQVFWQVWGNILRVQDNIWNIKIYRSTNQREIIHMLAYLTTKVVECSHNTTVAVANCSCTVKLNEGSLRLLKLDLGAGGRSIK